MTGPGVVQGRSGGWLPMAGSGGRVCVSFDETTLHRRGFITRCGPGDSWWQFRREVDRQWWWRVEAKVEVEVAQGFWVSLFETKLSREPVRVCLDPDGGDETLEGRGRSLHWWVSRPVVVRDAELRPAWSPALYEEGATRGARNVRVLTALVLDYDAGESWERARALWSPWLGFMHTTYSHQQGWEPLDKRGPSPEAMDVLGPREKMERFRVVLPLARAIEPGLFVRLWRWAYERSGEKIDEKCKDPSRIYFSPCVRHPMAYYRCDWWGGDGLLDPDGLALPPAVKVVPRVPAPAVAGVPGWMQKSRGIAEVELALRWAKDNQGREVESERVAVEKAVCPQCGRFSVFVLRGETMAQCNHRKSCGFRGRPWRS